MDRQRIERQLKLAQDKLQQCQKALGDDKVASRDAKWRSLDADCRALKRRLNAVSAVEEREAAAIQRKAEKEQAAE
jgi:hypothetical protein